MRRGSESLAGAAGAESSSCRRALPLSSIHQHHLEGKLKCGALGATPERPICVSLRWGLTFAFLRSPQVILILLVPRTTHPEPFPRK